MTAKNTRKGQERAGTDELVCVIKSCVLLLEKNHTQKTLMSVKPFEPLLLFDDNLKY